MAILLPHDAVVAQLRGSNIPKLDWTNGPWLDEAAEPQPDFPFLVYKFNPTKLELCIGTKPFISEYEVEFELHALEPDIAALVSEYGDPAVSVFAFLDKYVNLGSPVAALSSSGVFNCTGWVRTMPVDVKMSEKRSPTTPRVWKGSTKYLMTVTADMN